MKAFLKPQDNANLYHSWSCNLYNKSMKREIHDFFFLGWSFQYFTRTFYRVNWNTYFGWWNFIFPSIYVWDRIVLDLSIYQSIYLSIYLFRFTAFCCKFCVHQIFKKYSFLPEMFHVFLFKSIYLSIYLSWEFSTCFSIKRKKLFWRQWLMLPNCSMTHFFLLLFEYRWMYISCCFFLIACPDLN